MGRQRLRLILQMALHRPKDALGAMVLALVLVLTCGLVSGFVSAYKLAIERGAQSGFGIYSNQVTGNEDVANYMRSLQEKGKAVTISHSRQNLLAANGHHATTADVTLTSGSADLGVLLSGHYPKNPGELTVSTAVASQLKIQPGDHLNLVDIDNDGTKSAFVLVGVTENPASINEVSAEGITNNEAMIASAEVWLTNDNLADIGNVIDHGGGEVATVSSVIDRASVNAVSYQAVSPQLAWLFAVLMILALVAAIYAADRQRRRAVYGVLVALGDRPTRAALTTCAQTTLLAFCGGLIGWGIALISLPSLSGQLATFFEQHWAEITYVPVTLAALIALTVIMLGGALAAGITVMSEKRRARSVTEGFSRRALMGVGLIGTLVTILLVISRQLFIFPQGHRAAMIVGALTIPALAYSFTLATHKHRVVSRLGNRLQKLVLGALAVIFVLNYWGAFYASAVVNLTNWLGGQINGVNSYLQIGNANEQAINNLMKRFPELKSRTAVFGDISNKDQMFRITDSNGAECFKTAKTMDDCPQNNLDGVYIALGGLSDRKYIDHGPASYVTKGGKVALIGIGLTDSKIKQFMEVGGITGDKDLDNNVLRGLILAENSPLLEKLGVTKPQSYTAIITGFGSLPDEVRDGVRATVLTQAPFAVINDTDDPEVRQLRAQAVARQLLAIIVSGTLLLAFVSTIVSDQRIERRLIELTGGNKISRARLVKPLLFAYIVTVVSAVILGRLSAMDRIPFTHLQTAVVHDYGLIWTLGLLGLVFLIPALILATQPTFNSESRS